MDYHFRVASVEVDNYSFDVYYNMEATVFYDLVGEYLSVSHNYSAEAFSYWISRQVKLGMTLENFDRGWIVIPKNDLNGILKIYGYESVRTTDSEEESAL